MIKRFYIVTRDSLDSVISFVKIFPLIKEGKIKKLRLLHNIFLAAPYIKRINLVNRVCFFEYTERNALLVIINNIKMIIETREEWSILEEIYGKGDYNYIIPNECIVLDIGMNVGLTSLFYASKGYVKNIYGYEPVIQSYNRALENFQLNPDLASKIKPNNFGIAKNSEKATFSYYKNSAGNAKRIENIEPVSNDLIDVELKAVKDILAPLFLQNQHNSIILKLDCEGAEYEIIDELIDEKLLSNVKAMVLEWHEQGNGCVLAEKLTSNNFITVLNFDYKHCKCGLIYAFNTILDN